MSNEKTLYKPDSAITEAQLNKEYEENGKTFKSLIEAEDYLARKGFKKVTSTVYKNNIGKIANLYKLRDAIFKDRDSNEIIGYKFNGFLVSFGGEPRSGYDLKITKIKRPEGH